MSKKFIVLDTETAPEKGCKGCDPHKMRVYDLGYVVSDLEGVIYARRDIAIKEVFMDADLMQSAHYAAKIPQYFIALADAASSKKLMGFHDAMKQLAQDVETFSVRELWAYNARFDYNVLNHTAQVLSNGYRRFALPYGLPVYDIMPWCKSTIAATAKYKAWAKARKLITRGDNPRVTVEALTQYLRKDDEYRECHTALEDAQDEHALLMACRKRHQKAPKPLFTGRK